MGDEVLCQLPCEHYFHKQCVETWWNTQVHDAAGDDAAEPDLKRQKKHCCCPLCRKDFRHLRKFTYDNPEEGIKIERWDPNLKRPGQRWDLKSGLPEHLDTNGVILARAKLKFTVEEPSEDREERHADTLYDPERLYVEVAGVMEHDSPDSDFGIESVCAKRLQKRTEERKTLIKNWAAKHHAEFKRLAKMHPNWPNSKVARLMAARSEGAVSGLASTPPPSNSPPPSEPSTSSSPEVPSVATDDPEAGVAEHHVPPLTVSLPDTPDVRSEPAPEQTATPRWQDLNLLEEDVKLRQKVREFRVQAARRNREASSSTAKFETRPLAPEPVVPDNVDTGCCSWTNILMGVGGAVVLGWLWRLFF